MRWLNANESVQHTQGRDYVIVQAVEGIWLAYKLGPTHGEELGRGGTDAEAREICEIYEDRRERKRA